MKPEHKQHRKVGMLTDRQYRLWIGMLTEADDEGRLCADPVQLRATIFPYQPRTTVQHVSEALDAVRAVGLVRVYRVGDVLYADFPSWHEHQKINRATASKLPPFQGLAETHGPFSEGSVSAHHRSDLIGSESIGSEGSGGALAPADRPSPRSHANGASAKASTGAPPPEMPPTIAKTLERAPRLGPFCRDAKWWLSEMRANPTVDLAAELLKADAWCQSNPERAPRKRPRAFLHRWFARAGGES